MECHLACLDKSALTCDCTRARLHLSTANNARPTAPGQQRPANSARPTAPGQQRPANSARPTAPGQQRPANSAQLMHQGLGFSC
uniref:Uncharacterized protein n=1 Tax=Knipowitschia caucasica TaxID=637954 RepID=A0AAV2JVD8_KNICA